SRNRNTSGTYSSISGGPLVAGGWLVAAGPSLLGPAATSYQLPTSRIQIDDAERERDGGNLDQSRMSQDCHKLRGRGERADRRRQIAVRGAVARQQPSNARQDLAEIPRVRLPYDRQRRHRELEDRQASTRPQDAHDLSTRRRHILHIADAEADGDGVDTRR